MLVIAVNNGLGLLAVYIGNAFYMDPYAENIWSCCGAEFGPRCGALVFLKRYLYISKKASNSFHKYVVEFIRDLGFTLSIAYQDLWIRKSYKYD